MRLNILRSCRGWGSSRHKFLLPSIAYGCVALLASAGSAAGQTSTPAGTAEPKHGGVPAPLPPVAPGPEAPPAIAVPVPGTPAAPMISEGPTFLLKAVTVDGNAILSPEEVHHATDEFVGKKVGINQLEEIRRRLTVLCVDKGFVNSGAVLPDQPIGDGSIRFRIVEGKLNEIRIVGTNGFSESYFRDRLELAAEPPLNVNALNRAIRVLLQNPGVERINADLEPALEPGSALLTATVTEAKPWTLAASVANDSPPSIGSLRGQIAGTYRNFLHSNDVLALSYARTGGVNDGSASWSVPLSAEDTTLTVHYDYDGSVVLDRVFEGLNINSRTQTEGLILDQPLFRTGDQALDVSLAYDHRTSRTYVLNQPFSLSPGSVNGKTTANVLRIAANWLNRSTVDVFAARATVSLGLRGLDSTSSPIAPNGHFDVFLGQLQYVRKISDSFRLLARTDVQLADEPLYSFEQIALGGADTVRGYRENELVRDDGVLATLEGHYAVLKLPQLDADDGSSDDERVVEIVPFFDYGDGWNVSHQTPRPQQIESLGLGIHFSFGPRLTGRVDYGYALRPVHNSGHDLQDSGIHFLLATQI